jgi:aspartyl/glutamyl-tRNA(Asn/Gln) amidotransferase C subunit
MSVTQDQIKKIATKLCKLPSEEDKIIGDIQNILSYVEMLSEVDTTGVKATVSVVDHHYDLRKDEEEQKFATPDQLLACSPQKVIARQVTLGGIMAD